MLNFATITQLWPGVLTAITIALAASFVAEHQGGPQLLYALFFGMAFNFAAEGEKIRAGIEFAS
nr:putative sulfate exporter family transporter [Aromatoleum toluolicum]